MPFACIYVPDFPVEAILRAEPDLRSQALAVLEGKAPLQKVFAVNGKARREGVVPGMTKIQVEACAHLALRDRSLLQEGAAHAALLECAQGFSPRVEDLAADTLVLDIVGLGKLFGPLPKIARELARRSSELGLQCNVAVAANPDTAMLAARRFDGVTVIPEGREAEQLGSLPVEVLCAEQDDPESEQLLETLHRWGIRNLRDLAALPDVALSERLGQHGLEWQRLARGHTARTLVPYEPPSIFEEVIELEHPVVLLEPLAILLGEMLEQLCARLQAHALATQELRLELELESGYIEDCDERVGTGVLARPGRAQTRQLFRRILRLPLPLLDAKTFLKLLQLDLNAHPPGAPIGKIRLIAEPTRPRAAQNGFFVPPSPEPEKLELTMAKIAGIVGEDRVGSLELLDTHRPEGFEMQHFTPFEEPQNLGRGFTRINADRFNEKSSQNEFSVSQCLCGENLVPAPRRHRGTEKTTNLGRGFTRINTDQFNEKSNPNEFSVPQCLCGENLVPAPRRHRGTEEIKTLRRGFTRMNADRFNEKSKSKSSEFSMPLCLRGGDDLVTALRRFRPPAAATVTIHDGRPAHISCSKHDEIHGEILWTAGPWRSSGDWWEQNGWARDEWDIAVQEESGIALYRLVRDLLSGKWFVEGTYD